MLLAKLLQSNTLQAIEEYASERSRSVPSTPRSIRSGKIAGPAQQMPYRCPENYYNSPYVPSLGCPMPTCHKKVGRITTGCPAEQPSVVVRRGAWPPIPQGPYSLKSRHNGTILAATCRARDRYDRHNRPATVFQPRWPTDGQRTGGQVRLANLLARRAGPPCHRNPTNAILGVPTSSAFYLRPKTLPAPTSP